jgi:FkbM family methyltransferase
MRSPRLLGEVLKGDRFAGKLLRPLVNAFLPARPTPITVLSGPGAGGRLLIEPRVEKFYWTGAHEPAVQDQLCLELKPGNTFWDVGAHIGFFTVIASRLVGQTGTVHAFEPHEANRKRLWKSLELSNINNVTVHREALGVDSGRRHLYPSGSSLMWSLVDGGGGGAGETVDCTTIDAMVRQLGAPNLMKVDVEGAECEVLEGGRYLLGQHSVRLIVEFLTSQGLERARSRWPNYRFRKLDDQNWLMIPASAES